MATTYLVVNGMVLQEDRDGTVREYRPDTLGSTVALTDATTATDTWEYWPYGEVRTRTGTNPTPFQFGGVLGYYRDSSTRTYVRARHYRQGIGRWQTVDPLWPREKPYAYVGGAPQQANDMTGLLGVCAVACACAAACIIDMLLVCADWSGFASYGDCLWSVFSELPGWLKALCGGCIAVCIACLVRNAVAPRPMPGVGGTPPSVGGGGRPGPPPRPVPWPPRPAPAPRGGPGIEPVVRPVPWWRDRDCVLCWPACLVGCGLQYYFVPTPWDLSCLGNCLTRCRLHMPPTTWFI